MTVSTTSSRVSYAGNGSTTTFNVNFYFLANADLVVIKTSSVGVQTTLTLTTDYTVSGAGSLSGGSVTLVSAPANGETLTIFRDPALTQLVDYQPNDPFPAATHEQALDKLTMITQRLKDLISRSFRLSDGDTTTASTVLPTPSGGKIIGWDQSATGLANYDVEDFVGQIAAGSFYTQNFSGNASTTTFTLSSAPASLSSLEVFISGVRQVSGTDYTLSGTTLTFTSAPPTGASNIFVRWGSVAVQGYNDASIVYFTPGSGGVSRDVQTKLREFVSVKDYGAKGDGSTDDTLAIQAAAAAVQSAGGGVLWFPKGTYIVFSNTTGTLCSFSNLTGISCLGYGATIKVPTTKTITASEGYYFYFSNCKNITVDGFATDGPTLDVSNSTVKGYEFVRCVNGCRNVNMPNNRIKNSLAGFICSKAAGDADSMRTQNIHIGVLDVQNCWYGINGQYSGDFMQVDCLRTDTIHRSFFVYGASNIKAKILSKDHKGADVPVTSLSGLAVTGVDIDYWSTEDSTACGSAPKVEIGFSNETASTLRDVRINLNVAYAGSGNTGGAALFITKLNNSGNPDSSDRGHILDNLRVSGTITGTASYNSGGSIVTDTGATWGTGDYFRNIAFENLRITGANGQSQINVTFGNVQDNILFKNVYSNYTISVKNSATDFRLPYVATTELLNVKCTNLTELSGSAQPLTILRGVGAPDTVQTGWSGKTIGNLGIGGNAVWNLPAAVPGLTYRFVRNDNYIFDIDPSGSEIIRGGTAGQMLRMNTAGNMVVIACYITGYWDIVSSQGSYTFV